MTHDEDYELSTLLEYPEESAGGIMQTELVKVRLRHRARSAPGRHPGQRDDRKGGEVHRLRDDTDARLNRRLALARAVERVGSVEAFIDERARVRSTDLKDRVVNGREDGRSKEENGDDRSGQAHHRRTAASSCLLGGWSVTYGKLWGNPWGRVCSDPTLALFEKLADHEDVRAIAPDVEGALGVAPGEPAVGGELPLAERR